MDQYILVLTISNFFPKEKEKKFKQNKSTKIGSSKHILNEAVQECGLSKLTKN